MVKAEVNENKKKDFKKKKKKQKKRKEKGNEKERKKKKKKGKFISDFLFKLFGFISSPLDIFLNNFTKNYKTELIQNNYK